MPDSQDRKPPVPPGGNAEPPAGSQDSPGGKPSSKPPSQATRLVRQVDDLRESRAVELFHSPTGQTWISAQVPASPDGKIPAHRETWPLHSKAFREWQSRQFYQEHRGSPGSQAQQDAINVLSGIAQYDGPELPVHVRLTGADEAVSYLDLGDPAWTVVKITARGWEILPDDAPVRFWRPRGYGTLPTPERGGSLEDLRPFVNTDDESWPPVAAWTVGAMNPTGPYFVLSLLGSQGSAKSTTARFLRELLDPNAIALRRPPRDERSLAIAATNGRVLAFDNLSAMPEWLSDVLCTLASGGGFATRELYSDADERLFEFTQQPILLTSIEDVAVRGDLLDRALLAYLPQLPGRSRQPEAVVRRKFHEQHPRLLGALLDASSLAYRCLPDVPLVGLPRMADAARFVTAANGALGLPEGTTFLSVYQGNQAEANEIAVNASIVGRSIRFLVETGRIAADEPWEGTARELLRVLNEVDARQLEEARRSKEWPPDPTRLSGKLRSIAPALGGIGIEVAFERVGKDRERRLSIMRLEKLRNLASAASAASAKGPNMGTDLGKEGRTLEDEPASAQRPPASAQRPPATTANMGVDQGKRETTGGGADARDARDAVLQSSSNEIPPGDQAPDAGLFSALAALEPLGAKVLNVYPNDDARLRPRRRAGVADWQAKYGIDPDAPDPAVMHRRPGEPYRYVDQHAATVRQTWAQTWIVCKRHGGSRLADDAPSSCPHCAQDEARAREARHNGDRSAKWTRPTWWVTRPLECVRHGVKFAEVAPRQVECPKCLAERAVQAPQELPGASEPSEHTAGLPEPPRPAEASQEPGIAPERDSPPRRCEKHGAALQEYTLAPGQFYCPDCQRARLGQPPHVAPLPPARTAPRGARLAALDPAGLWTPAGLARPGWRPASALELLEAARELGAAEVWVHPDSSAALGLQLAPDVRTAGPSPFLEPALSTWKAWPTAPLEGFEPEGLSPWLRCKPRGAGDRAEITLALVAAVPDHPLEPFGQLPDGPALLRAVELLRTRLGVPFASSPSTTARALLDLGRGLQAGRAEPPPVAWPREEGRIGWTRPLTDAERAMPYVQVFDVNGQDLGTAVSLELGAGAPEHRSGPLPFDRTLPGYWLAPLPEHPDPPLPDPFAGRLTGAGLPGGPRWVTTPTLELAAELGFEVAPLEAWVWPEHRRFLRPAAERLRNARAACQADPSPESRAALEVLKLAYTKMLGRLESIEQGYGGELLRPDWTAQVVAKSAANLYRKLERLRAAPFAVNVDALYFAASSPDPAKVAASLGLQLDPSRVLLGKFKPAGTVPMGALSGVDLSGGRETMALHRALEGRWLS